ARGRGARARGAGGGAGRRRPGAAARGPPRGAPLPKPSPRLGRGPPGDAEPLLPHPGVAVRHPGLPPALPQDAEGVLREPVAEAPRQQAPQHLGLLAGVDVLLVLCRPPALLPAPPGAPHVSTPPLHYPP